LFFNFAALFDYGCCSLAQEMSFVDRYLLCFRQWLITHLLSALLSFQSLFTESSHGDQFLAHPLFSGCTYSTPPLLLCVPFQFLVYYSGLFCLFDCFSRAGDQSVQEAMLVYPRGGVGIPHDTWCLPVGLLNISQVGLELASGGAGAILFSQCNVVWRSFV
jgi:hypothetical protein